MVYYIESPTGSLELDDRTTVLSENHTLSNNITNQVLEDGSALQDHAIINPIELECVIHVSNAPNGKERFPSISVVEVLEKMRTERALVSVYTLHKNYKNMAVASITVPNVAPFKGRTDITVKFIQVRITAQSLGKIDRDTVSPVEIPEDELPETTQEKTVQDYEEGKLPKPDQVTDSATTKIEAGESPDSTIGSNYDVDTMSNVSVSPDLTLSNSSKQNNTSLFAFYEMQKQFQEMYPETLLGKVKETLKEVKQGIKFISNLSVGSQSLLKTVQGQVMSMSMNYNTLDLRWECSIDSNNGNNVCSGVLLQPGYDFTQGLRLNDGKKEISLKGLYMSPPINQKYDKTSVGIESSPYAFSPNKNGVAPCSLFYFEDEAYNEKFKDLLLNFRKKDPLVDRESDEYIEVVHA